jgi:XrtJ-associated TM-motif-TM protein
MWKRARLCGSLKRKETETMRIWARVMLLAVMVVCGLGVARAQLGGCTDSPENPTAVLMVVGAAAFAWPLVRAKAGAWRKK